MYLADRRTGRIQRITNRDHPSRGSYHLDMSADGRYVAYTQSEPRGGGGRLWVRDRRTGAEERVDVKPDGTPARSTA